MGDPFYGKLIGFIEEYVRKMGYYLIFYSAKDVEDIFRMVMGWDVDGVIALSFSRRNCEKNLSAYPKSLLSLWTHTENWRKGRETMWSISGWTMRAEDI